MLSCSPSDCLGIPGAHSDSSEPIPVPTGSGGIQGVLGQTPNGICSLLGEDYPIMQSLQGSRLTVPMPARPPILLLFPLLDGSNGNLRATEHQGELGTNPTLRLGAVFPRQLGLPVILPLKLFSGFNLCTNPWGSPTRLPARGQGPPLILLSIPVPGPRSITTVDLQTPKASTSLSLLQHRLAVCTFTCVHACVPVTVCEISDQQPPCPQPHPIRKRLYYTP